MKVINNLRIARELLSRKERWLEGNGLAETRGGIRTFAEEKGAVRWTLLGAILKASQGHDYPAEAIRYVSRYLAEHHLRPDLRIFNAFMGYEGTLLILQQAIYQREVEDEIQRQIEASQWRRVA